MEDDSGISIDWKQEVVDGEEKCQISERFQRHKQGGISAISCDVITGGRDDVMSRIFVSYYRG